MHIIMYSHFNGPIDCLAIHLHFSTFFFFMVIDDWDWPFLLVSILLEKHFYLQYLDVWPLPDIIYGHLLNAFTFIFPVSIPIHMSFILDRTCILRLQLYTHTCIYIIMWNHWTGISDTAIFNPNFQFYENPKQVLVSEWNRSYRCSIAMSRLRFYTIRLTKY